MNEPCVCDAQVIFAAVSGTSRNVLLDAVATTNGEWDLVMVKGGGKPTAVQSGPPGMFDPEGTRRYERHDCPMLRSDIRQPKEPA